MAILAETALRKNGARATVGARAIGARCRIV